MWAIIGIGGLGFVGFLSVIGLVSRLPAPSQEPQATTVRIAHPYTLEQFYNLDSGMSRARVEKIMGGPGVTRDQITTENAIYTTEIWANVPDGGLISVTFRNGIVDHVYQSGLRL